MSRLAEIDERMTTIRSELLELAENDLDETQAARFDELETEHGQLETEREPLARRAQTVERVRTSYNLGGSALESGGGPDVMQRRDPYADLEQIRGGQLGGGDLRSRALTAIEQAPSHMADGQRETATQLVQRNDRHGRIARHMLLTGSEDYSRAFEEILTGTQPWELEPAQQEAFRTASLHARAMNEGTNSAGGYMVPFHLDPTIILTNVGSTNPFRQISRVDTITTNEWHGVSSAGVTAEWLAEAVEAADASPSFAQPTVPVHKAAAYLQASFEVTQDTNVVGQVGMLLADARDNLEAAAFAVGSGSGQPTGVVTAVAANGPSVVTGSGTGGTYVVDDVYALKAAMTPRHRPMASWVANDNILSQTRQFATGSGPTHAFWADLGMNTPSQLLGRPVYESSEMVEAAATGANILLVGNFGLYLIVNRIGMTVQFEPLVKGANQRPTGEVGWFAHWRVGGNILDANAFRVLQPPA